jgi:hypothetical protein
MSLGTVPVVSGGQDERGHLEEFRTDPIALMHRVREECGDVDIFHLAHKKVVLLSGAQASKVIFSVLLRECEFEMAQLADTYRNDHSKMVVQLERPAKVRYHRRRGPRT